MIIERFSLSESFIGLNSCRDEIGNCDISQTIISKSDCFHIQRHKFLTETPTYTNDTSIKISAMAEFRLWININSPQNIVICHNTIGEIIRKSGSVYYRMGCRFLKEVCYNSIHSYDAMMIQ